MDAARRRVVALFCCALALLPLAAESEESRLRSYGSLVVESPGASILRFTTVQRCTPDASNENDPTLMIFDAEGSASQRARAVRFTYEDTGHPTTRSARFALEFYDPLCTYLGAADFELSIRRSRFVTVPASTRWILVSGGDWRILLADEISLTFDS